MSTTLVILFWISFSILFYCYIGYGILVFIISAVKKIFATKERDAPPPLPVIPVTLVVTAYNEEAIIEQKIRNSLEIEYPAGQLQLIFITDGSSDQTVSLVQRHPSVLLLHQPERRGKYAAIKRAMKHVQTPVVIFSDANTMLNAACVKNIVAHYADERVGGVAGEKKIMRNHDLSAVGEAEGIYWKYESTMKKLDAQLNTVTGAAGELFSIRTSLFRELDDELILDDFVISMQVCLQGYRIEYEPSAFATELPSVSLAEEAKRKIRISAGAYQSIGYLKECLNLFRHPVLSFQYISRRLFRWILCPLMLVILLLSNFGLVINQPAGIYNWTLYAQLAFYFFALLGGFFVQSGRRVGLLTIPFYFVFMNYCLVKGLVKFMKHRQSVLWEKSMRQVMEPH